jgi:hypothetical protein
MNKVTMLTLGVTSDNLEVPKIYISVNFAQPSQLDDTIMWR